MAIPVALAALIAACGPSGETPDGSPEVFESSTAALTKDLSDCDPAAPETSAQYSAACVQALELQGMKDLAFDCDDATKSVEVPTTNALNGKCDRPNVLIGVV